MSLVYAWVNILLFQLVGIHMKVHNLPSSFLLLSVRVKAGGLKAFRFIKVLRHVAQNSCGKL